MPTEIINRAFALAEADESTDTGNVLDGAKIILWTNPDPFVPTALTAYADLVQPTFAGYAISAAVVWNDAYIGADGEIHLTAPSKLFRATAVVSPGQAVQGYAITTGAGPGYGLAEIVVFDEPFTFTLANEALMVDIDITRPA